MMDAEVNKNYKNIHILINLMDFFLNKKYILKSFYFMRNLNGQLSLHEAEQTIISW